MHDPAANAVIAIPLNKGRIALLFFGSVTFVVLGYWFVTSPDTFKDTPFLRSHITAQIIGGLSMLFFSACALVAIKKFFDKKPGIVIDNDGIRDNSSGFSQRYIAWDNIAGFELIQIRRQTLIMVHLKDPEAYLQTLTGVLSRQAASSTYKMYGTPVAISTSTLRYDANALFALLKSRSEEVSMLQISESTSL